MPQIINTLHCILYKFKFACSTSVNSNSVNNTAVLSILFFTYRYLRLKQSSLIVGTCRF